MTARVATFAWLVVVWLVAVEATTVGAAVVGVVVAGAVMAAFRPATRGEGQVRVRPVALAAYVGRFLVDLVHANLQVAYAVLSPTRAGVRQAIVAVPVAPMPDTATMVLANAISLTPGTFIVDIRSESHVFYLHVLRLESVPELLDEMWRLQLRLARGLGLAEAEATLGTWLADPGRAPTVAPWGGER